MMSKIFRYSCLWLISDRYQITILDGVSPIINPIILVAFLSKNAFCANFLFFIFFCCSTFCIDLKIRHAAILPVRNPVQYIHAQHIAHTEEETGEQKQTRAAADHFCLFLLNCSKRRQSFAFDFCRHRQPGYSTWN